MIIFDIILWQISLYELINVWVPGMIFVFMAYRIGRGKIKSGGGIVLIEKINSEDHVVCKINNIPYLYINELDESNCSGFERMINFYKNFSIPHPFKAKSQIALKKYEKNLPHDEIFSILIKNNWEIVSCVQTDPLRKFLIIKKKY